MRHDDHRPPPRIGSLCTGYGGLDLAVLAVLGGHLAWVADNDPAATRLLAPRWPGVPNLGDITTVDWTRVPSVDVLACGWPCQDISHAGTRRGMAGPRSRLWNHVAHAVVLNAANQRAQRVDLRVGRGQVLTRPVGEVGGGSEAFPVSEQLLQIGLELGQVGRVASEMSAADARVPVGAAFHDFAKSRLDQAPNEHNRPWRPR